MSMHETHLVMYGIKLPFELGVELFYGSHDNRDEGELLMDVPAIIEKPFRMHKPLEDGRKIREVPVVLIDDGMGCQYFMAGRVIDYAQVEEGESLSFTCFGDRNRPDVEKALSTADKQETIEALLGVPGITNMILDQTLSFYVFTHVS
ncbi:hypothetical protein hairong_152 [Pseudomonas phage hairong]|nr:hypothetical protein hairong_152 [Pseudomonas phage hairong]